MSKWLLFALFPVLSGVVASAALAQAPVYDPQGRMIPHDERRIEPQNEAVAAEAPVARTRPATKKHRMAKHAVKKRATATPALKKKTTVIRKKHKKAAPR